MNISRRLIILSLPVILVVLLIFSLNQMLDIGYETDITNLKERSPVKSEDQSTQFIGVVSRFAPSLIYKGYQPLIDYLNSNTQYHFELRINSSYDEAVQQLAGGELQAAFLGTFVFLKNVEAHPISAFLAPLNSAGQPFFQAVVITLDDYPFENLLGLGNKKIGVPSKLSYSGNWLQNDEIPRIFRDKQAYPEFIHYNYHHTVIQHLFRGDISAGVIKDRVAEEYAGKGIRVVKSSRLIPASPLVRGPGSDEVIITAISKALTGLSLRDTSMLNEWDPEFRNGFIIVTDSLYLSMKNYINQGS